MNVETTQKEIHKMLDRRIGRFGWVSKANKKALFYDIERLIIFQEGAARMGALRGVFGGIGEIGGSHDTHT